MSPPSSPSTYQFTVEDLDYLDNLAFTQETQTTWEEDMQALAKHRGLPRSQLPAEPPGMMH